LAKFLTRMPNLKLEILGHADKTGSAQINYVLAKKRAKTVMNYLIAKGILKSRLSPSSYSAERPLASNRTKEGQRLNRRVEFELIVK